jgi:phage N-6-adenine-methyltransferase
MATRQKPGRSKQDYGTPADFIAACERRFGPLTIDLACRTDNCKAPHGIYFDEGYDSLAETWGDKIGSGVGWLNPPFADIAPWARRCSMVGATLTTGRILMLTPASIGSNWFEEHVHGTAYVIGLSPRMTFEGASDPYPKDLMLTVFGGGVRGFDTWRWK